jgi:acid-sensing ion channel, other
MFLGIPGVKLCGNGEESCCEGAHAALLERDSELEDGWQKSSCGCLPDCNTLSYDVEISQTPTNFTGWFKKVILDDFFENSRSTNLRIAFKDSEFVAIRRMELHGPIDFLADCGGLLGLFMGISFISILELAYFCTIRLLSNLQEQRQHCEEKAVKVVPKTIKPIRM